MEYISQNGHGRYRERGKDIDSGKHQIATHRLYYRNNLLTTSTYDLYHTQTDDYEYEACADAVHKKSKDGKYHTGGPLVLRKVTQRTNPFDGDINRSWGTDFSPWESRFSGQIHAMLKACPFSSNFFGVLPSEDFGDVSDYGPEGFAKYSPGRPPVSAGVFLGELRELPKMLSKRAYAHKNAGQHYLNFQFGWLPFVSDLKRMYDLAFDLERRLQNIEKMNGKWHTRGGTLVNEKSTEAEPGDTSLRMNPANSYVIDSTTALNSYSLVSTKKVWFKGRFCYYIPPSEFRRPEWRLNTIRKMYGLSITPDLVWNLTPWSWLADYFTNVGDIMENLSGGVIDGVVSKYAYVMGTTRLEYVQDSSVETKSGGRIHASVSRGHTMKQRVAGNPFSFQLSGDLSTRQTAILAALGISRL